MGFNRELSELASVISVSGSQIGIGGAPIGSGTISIVASGDAIQYLSSSAGNTELYFNNNGANLQWIKSNRLVGDLIFGTSDTQRFSIDTNGNFGFGSSAAPLAANLGTFMDINGLSIIGNGTSGSYIGDNVYHDGSNFQYTRTSGSSLISFANNGEITFRRAASGTAGTNISYSEPMRIDTNNALLVGKTVLTGVTTTGTELRADGEISIRREGGIVMDASRGGSSGIIMQFRQDITTAGYIGVSGNAYFSGASFGLKMGSQFVGCTAAGVNSDNAVDVGAPSVRFNDVYATNGTINTSDIREKEQIRLLTGAELAAAADISKSFRMYKWKSSVAEKGDDARLHTGVMAQAIKNIMQGHGLDAGDYAFFIHSTWHEDANGNALLEDQLETIDVTTLEEKDRMGIRYEELMAFIGAATEQRLENIEERLNALGA